MTAGELKHYLEVMPDDTPVRVAVWNPDAGMGPARELKEIIEGQFYIGINPSVILATQQ